MCKENLKYGKFGKPRAAASSSGGSTHLSLFPLLCILPSLAHIHLLNKKGTSKSIFFRNSLFQQASYFHYQHHRCSSILVVIITTSKVSDLSQRSYILQTIKIVSMMRTRVKQQTIWALDRQPRKLDEANNAFAKINDIAGNTQKLKYHRYRNLIASVLQLLHIFK